MKVSWNAIIQGAATALQGANAAQFGHLLPQEWQVPVALILSAIQSIIAVLAHFKNPDGTTARTAYIPSKPAYPEV